MRRGTGNPMYNIKGKKAPGYIHGLAYEPYNIGFTNELKEKIRKRDNYTCQKCDVKEKDYYRKLDVHHIDYNKKNIAIKNLISLCGKCNIKVNTNRDYWYAYFGYLILNKSRGGYYVQEG